MFTGDCILAALLLTSAPEVPLSDEALAWAEACRVSLVALALDAEVLDPREQANYLNALPDYPSDLRALQGRFRDYAFAPLADECRRFPERRTINEFLAFNRAYRQELVARLEVDPVHADHLRQAVQETDQLHQIWQAMRDARCGYYYVTVRREALQLVRDLLGAEAFFSGRLPPYVPVWRLPVAR